MTGSAIDPAAPRATGAPARCGEPALKVLVVVGHPRAGSLSHALAGAYGAGARRAGVEVRELAGEREIPARVAANNAVWTGSPVTPERYALVSHLSTYRRELDLVAVAPDGSFAAFGIAWIAK